MFWTVQNTISSTLRDKCLTDQLLSEHARETVKTKQQFDNLDRLLELQKRVKKTNYIYIRN